MITVSELGIVSCQGMDLIVRTQVSGHFFAPDAFDCRIV